MAIIRNSPLVAAISGNVAGLNFAQGGQGAYVRKSLTRTNQKTAGQLTHRATVQRLRNAWDALTDAQRTQWELTAALTKRADRFGTKRALSARALFFATNANAAVEALGIQEDPPALVPAEPPTIYGFSCRYPAAITLSLPVTSYPSGSYWCIWVARSFTTTRPRRYRGWRWACNISVADHGPAVDISTPLHLVLGDPANLEWFAVKLQTYVPGLLPSPIAIVDNQAQPQP